VLDLRRLRLLRELAHRGTLGAVAEALSYAPSTVSQQLSLLESEVGVPLLEPVGRRVRLTPQAEVLVPHTERILEELERAEAAVAASTAQVAGLVRVAAFPERGTDPAAAGDHRSREEPSGRRRAPDRGRT
jgi:DNA-binding transcriptional LysR family regulator